MSEQKYQCSNCGEIRVGKAIAEDLAMLAKHGVVEPMLNAVQGENLNLRCVLRPLSDVEIQLRLVQNKCEFKKCL